VAAGTSSVAAGTSSVAAGTSSVAAGASSVAAGTSSVAAGSEMKNSHCLFYIESNDVMTVSLSLMTLFSICKSSVLIESYNGLKLL
jgi:autotransporter adhesin